MTDVYSIQNFGENTVYIFLHKRGNVFSNQEAMFNRMQMQSTVILFNTKISKISQNITTLNYETQADYSIEIQFTNK